MTTQRRGQCIEPSDGRAGADRPMLRSCSRRRGRIEPRVLTTILVLAIVATVAGWWLFRKQEASRETGTATASIRSAWFEEVAAESGISFRHVSADVTRYWFPEITGAGVGLFDYDGDGYLDIYLVQSGYLDSKPTKTAPGNQLYRNRGDGTFENVTQKTGTGDTGYGMGCACGDYDGDGLVDLYVTNVGPNVLYRNNGNGTFTAVTDRAGVGDDAWSTSAAFVDFDSDADLDLFIVNYIGWSLDHDLACFSGQGARDYCSPNNYNAPAPDTLYRNNGNGTFDDISDAAGVRKTFGNGLGLACADFDLDGRLDFYVANDGMPNQLWLNSGGPGAPGFTDEALIAGCAVNLLGKSEAGMGVQAVDIDQDLDFDLFLSHLRNETNTFYLNQDGLFDDTTSAMGLAGPSIDFTGFGLGFADFNHDGRLDIYVANGRVKRLEPSLDPDDAYAEPNQLFAGIGSVRFEEVLPRGGTVESLILTSRGAAFGDLDNDGDIDIVVVNKDAPPYLLRNIAAKDGHWIMFTVLNRNGGHALHATVRLVAEGTVQTRMVQRAYGYCTSNDPRVHFGLGDPTKVDSVTVRWPTGGSETFGPLAAGQIHELRQGTGRPGAPG